MATPTQKDGFSSQASLNELPSKFQPGLQQLTPRLVECADHKGRKGAVTKEDVKKRCSESSEARQEKEAEVKKEAVETVLETTRNEGGSEEPHSDDAELWCIDGTEVDLNGNYKIGGHLWYLRERALDARNAGRPVAGTPMSKKSGDVSHGAEPLGFAMQVMAAKTPKKAAATEKNELKLEEAIPTELVMTRRTASNNEYDKRDVLENIRKKKARDVRKKKIEKSLQRAKGPTAYLMSSTQLTCLTRF